MRLAVVALLLSQVAQCTPGQPPAPTPAPTPTVTVPDPDPPAPIDAGSSDAGPDPIALEICYQNFQALNPDLDRAAVINLFCTGPDALAPWARRAAAKRAH